MVTTIDYLAAWWKQKSLWNCENLRSGLGHFVTESWPSLQRWFHHIEFILLCNIFDQFSESKNAHIKACSVAGLNDETVQLCSGFTIQLHSNVS